MSNANSVSDIERAEHLNFADGKGVKRVSLYNDGVQVKGATEAKQDDIITNQINGTKLLDEDENTVGVQYPLPTDGDSVYVKDLDIPNCDNGDFSGSISDYFDSLETVNTNNTATNPKIIKLWFKRTIYSHAIGFGCDNLSVGFGTSITIKLLGSGEDIRYTKTFTSTSENSFLAEFGPKAFNGIQIEFNTASQVCLSNLTIGKSIETNSTIQGMDRKGDINNVKTTIDGDLIIADNSSGLAIAKGDVTGHSVIQKFGNAPNFATADGFVTVWDGADDGTAWELNRYVYSTTADIDSISSSSASDTQAITVIGLDANYNEIEQTMTLNGQTRVSIPTPLIRVYRAYNDNSVDLVGNVIVYVNSAISGGVPTTKSNIRAIIDAENQQTEMAVYTIPAGKAGYLTRGYASTAGASKDSNYVIKFFARTFGKVFRLQNINAISDTGSSSIVLDYFAPTMIPEKTDLEFRVNMSAVGASGASISAGFDIVLIDN